MAHERQLQMKDKGFIGLYIIYILFVILDFYSTFAGGLRTAQVLEANPVYEYIGFTGIILLNLFVLFSLYYGYKKTPQIFIRYIIIAIMVTIILTRVSVVENNLEWQKMELTEEQLTEIEEMPEINEIKQMDTIKIAKKIYYPFFTAIFIYLIWRLDHDVGRK